MQFKIKDKKVILDTPTLIFHTFFVAFYLFFMMLAFQMPWPPILFPMILTISGVVLTVFVIFDELLSTVDKKSEPDESTKDSKPAKRKKYPLIFILFLPLFPIFNYFFGLLVAVALFSGMTMKYLGIKWKYLALSTIVFIICMYAMFYILKVDLPYGILFEGLM